jgi:hypothetical protein
MKITDLKEFKERKELKDKELKEAEKILAALIAKGELPPKVFMEYKEMEMMKIQCIKEFKKRKELKESEKRKELKESQKLEDILTTRLLLESYPFLSYFKANFTSLGGLELEYNGRKKSISVERLKELGIITEKNDEN